MNLLFICSRNQWRSPTAEKIFDCQAHPCRSAGTGEMARIKLNEKHIYWADLIFVMEKKHKQRLLEKFSFAAEGKEIVILDIPDEYQYMDDELIEMLRASVDPYIR